MAVVQKIINMKKPLNGIRVLDLTNVLAGPYCCHQLVHLGAEVIKVEAPKTGDLARQLGADERLNKKLMGISFLAQNAGKKSITLNLKSPRGKKLFLQLTETSDVLVENFRPGVMKRLRLDFEELKKINPDLIYCAISGFGQSGTSSDQPAYDQIIQGASGLMSITGNQSSSPLRVGFPVADTVGGITAAFAISSAHNANPRGAFIDVSMLEALMSSMGWAVSNYLNTGVEPLACGNENPTSAPSGTFKTSDGLLNIAANKDEHWIALTDHLDMAYLRDKPQYATREARKVNRKKLKKELEEKLKKQSAEKWAQELNCLGIPAGKVLTVAQALQSKEISESNFLTEYTDVPGVQRNLKLVTTGIKLNGEHPTAANPPSALGAHNEEIFNGLGVSSVELKELKRQGIV